MNEQLYLVELVGIDGMTLDEAIEYAKDHLSDIPLGELIYIPESDELNEEMCGFDA